MNLPLFRVQDDPGPDFSQLLHRSGFAAPAVDAEDVDDDDDDKGED